MLLPKKEKYRKQFRGKNRGMAQTGNTVVFGDYGLKAIGSGWVGSRALESARKKITFMTQRTGKYWIRVFPHKPITKKAVGVKMGSGKGAVYEHVAVVKPGTIIFELGGVPLDVAKAAFTKAGHKLPIKTVLVTKE